MQAEILLVLMLRYPRAVPTAELIEAVWHDAGWFDADAEPASACNNILAALRDLRGKVGSFHLSGRRNFGFRLVQQPGE